MDLTRKQKEILCVLAKEGPSWYYELSEKKKIASNKTVLKAFCDLTSIGLLEIKKEQQDAFMGRKRTYYGLTFKGLLYALNTDAFSPREAASVRLRNFVEIPSITDLYIKEDFEPDAFCDQVLEIHFPHSVLEKFERIRKLMASDVEFELTKLNSKVQKLVSKARQNGTTIRIFSIVEERFSERIYTKLRKVNPDPKYYDESYATAIFQKEHQKCLWEFFNEVIFKSDKAAIKEMLTCLSDPYTLDVFQAFFSYFAKVFPRIKKAIESMLEFESEEQIRQFNAEWTEAQKRLDSFSKIPPEELRSQFRDLLARIAQVKAMMKKL
jgi:hypothetical protein